MRCTDVGGTSKLANQVRRPNLVRLSKPRWHPRDAPRRPSAEPGSRVSNPGSAFRDHFLVREFRGSDTRTEPGSVSRTRFRRVPGGSVLLRLLLGAACADLVHDRGIGECRRVTERPVLGDVAE